jgi:hypothetical protein
MDIDRRTLLKGFFAVGLTAPIITHALNTLVPVAEAKSALSKVHQRRIILEILKEFDWVQEHMVRGQTNTPLLRSQVLSHCDLTMERFRSKGGIYAYHIVCDERNNPPLLVESNGFGLDAMIRLDQDSKAFMIEFT